MHSWDTRVKYICFVVVLLLSSCSSAEAATSPNEEFHTPVNSPAPPTAITMPEKLVPTSIAAASPLVPTETSDVGATATAEGINEISGLPAQSLNQIETPVADFKICSPLAGVELSYLDKIISDPYRPPPPGSDDRHEGVDFSYYNLAGIRTFIAGVGIQSVLPGIVAASIRDSYPYGNFVIIETPRELLPVALRHRLDISEGASLYLLYAHMQSAPVVSLGEKVDSCELVGNVGRTGNSGVAHLHLEARRGPAGAAFKSMAAFQPTVIPEQRANYKLWRTSGQYLHFDPMLIFMLR